VEAITGTGGRAIADGSNLGSIEGGQRAVQTTIDAFGRIDIVVNNAGIPGGGGGLDHPVGSELDLLFGVHYRGPIGTMSAAVPFMRERGFGRIVNTVSEVALDARTASGFGYGAAKAALWSATLGVANEVAADGITVNAVSPGARTRMNADLLDHGFRGGASNQLDLNPEHVARVVVYLCLPEAGDITGRIIHAAAGAVREYSTVRTSRSELVDRIQAVLDAPHGARRRGDG
jgi:NAD(P)-dependent dehydrogenase (short-subunit alcohol dehydrogenase family)